MNYASRCGGEKSPKRSGQTDARVLVITGGILFLTNKNAQTWNEHRRGGANYVTRELIDVTHLVDINGNDKAERELPAPDVPIDPKVEKHRKKGARFGETEEKELG